MKTIRELKFYSAPYGYIATIPKGTPVIPASNLPRKDHFWAEEWQGMTEVASSWQRNYGFLIAPNEVENE